MSRVIFDNQKGLFFDYDNEKYISTPEYERNFDKLDDETRQSIIEKLERNGFEYNEGEYNMLYAEPEVDYTSAYPQVDYTSAYPQVDYTSAYPQVDYTSAYPKAKEEDDIFEIMKDLDICEDIVINHDNDVKKTKVTHLLYDELRMPKEVAQYVELKLADYRVYTLCDSVIKQIWYDIKDEEEVAKKFMTAFLTIAVYNYYACLPVTYEDMTNDVMKLNREVITNHKLDLMIIDILQRYPEEYDRAVIKFMEHFNYCCLHYRKYSHFISKKEVLELLKNKYL